MPVRNTYKPGAWLACCAICCRTRYNYELVRGLDGVERGRPVCRDTCFSGRSPLSDRIRVWRPASRPTWPRGGCCEIDVEEVPQINTYERPLTYEELSTLGPGYGTTPYGAWGEFDAGNHLIRIFVP